jgi:hypothetical protein
MSRAEWESVSGRAYNKLCVEERKTKITQAVAYIQQYLGTELNKNISVIMSCGRRYGLQIWRITVNAWNELSRTEDGRTALGLGEGLIIVQSKKSSLL